jgi:uncharacterized membrane protein
LNKNDVHAHVQGRSTAECLVLTAYHNIPTDIISSEQGVEINVNQCINNTNREWKISAMVLLVQENLKEREKTKQEEKGNNQKNSSINNNNQKRNRNRTRTRKGEIQKRNEKESREK